MSVQCVTLTAADEKYAPPTQEIDLSIVSGIVFLTVYDGSNDDLSSPRKKAYSVPEIRLHDLIAAINAFADVTHGVLFAEGER